ncbi:MAG: TetR/AcrR family transcriptional regulator [Burkholderiaceae bacterium]|nr:TetR/AcrR family transcriptional regulator [Roseateles sp.]MBV8468672.1 TetR/AcrR family transcriptional regulator [Burkholderiaceae bacterium]
MSRSEKEQQIVEAAFGVFSRYGFARTTMADLAQAAGMSRPALYLVYCGKVEVFEAVVDWFIEQTLAEIHDTLDAHWPLERQLLHIAELAIARGFDMLKSNPDAADLMSPERHGPALQTSFDRVQQLLADVLREAVSRVPLGVTAEDLASMLMAAMKGFKAVARDGQHLRHLIATQVRVTVVALGEPLPTASGRARHRVRDA